MLGLWLKIQIHVSAKLLSAAVPKIEISKGAQMCLAVLLKKLQNIHCNSTLGAPLTLRGPMQLLCEKNNLEAKDLHQFLLGEIAILRIPNFAGPQFIANFVDSVRKLKTENYDHETEVEGKKVYQYYGVDRLGKSFNTTYSRDPKAIDAYYSQALAGTRLIRELGGSSISPIDRLRLELEEIFDFGAQIARFERRTMLAGITRISTSENAVLLGNDPHFDYLPTQYQVFQNQFAANIYLQVPESGGELELWPLPTDLKEGFDVPTNWAQKLSEQCIKSIRVKPNPGDLLLFNVRQPHAVHSFVGRSRISLQCFIGYNPGQSLKIWN